MSIISLLTLMVWCVPSTENTSGNFVVHSIPTRFSLPSTEHLCFDRKQHKTAIVHLYLYQLSFKVCEYGLRVEWQVTWKSTDIKRRLWIWNIIFLSFKSLLNCKTCKHCRCAFWFFGFSILYRNYLVWQCGDIAINFDWCDKLGSPILHNANIRIDLRVRTHHLLYVK